MFADNGKILAANQLIETLSGFILWRTKDQIALGDTRADALLRDAPSRQSIEMTPRVRAVVSRSQCGLRDDCACRAPHPQVPARDIFSSLRRVMLILTPVTRPEAPSVELIRSLFDLTPAEARVARGLAAGQTVRDLAADSGTSANTVRTHVNAVLTKTGYSRQSDVVALLNGLRPPGSASDA